MISNNAIIDAGAIIAENVTIGHGAIIGDQVKIDSGTIIGPYTTIQGPTTIGKNNKIFQYASIGDDPQDLTYQGEPTELIIGDENIIREYVTISRGTVKGGGVTKIGSKNFIMAYAHVGHDCILENNIIMTNYSGLSGHVNVGAYAIIGGYAGIHQFCTIGAHSFISRATYIGKDVLPYLIVDEYMHPCAINSVGLKRRGFSTESVDAIKKAFKIIFKRGLTTDHALDELHEIRQSCDAIQPMIDGIMNSSRGILR